MSRKEDKDEAQKHGTRALRAWLTALKQAYLEEKGRKGGNAKEYRHYVDKKADKDPEKATLLMRELLSISAGAVWRTCPKPKNTRDLFSVGDNRLPPELTFSDPTAPTGYTTVLTKLATVKMVEQDAQLSARKHVETGAAVAIKFKNVDALKALCNGDVTKLVANVATPVEPDGDDEENDDEIED